MRVLLYVNFVKSVILKGNKILPRMLMWVVFCCATCSMNQVHSMILTIRPIKTKGLITLCVDSLAFLFFSRFSRVLTRVFDTNIARKTREKSKT